MDRVFVYIDGRNFYFGLRDLDSSYTDLNFDFAKFVELINGVNWKNRCVEKIYYYNAPLKVQINPALARDQQRLFARLRSNSLFEVRLCKMIGQSTPQGTRRFDTKGDDIWLACDMLQDANDNNFDIAILVSCDGDFLKLVEYVQRFNKEVENAYFIGGGSVALRKQCAKFGDKIGIGPDLVEECLL